jgi:hypothetical protein
MATDGINKFYLNDIQNDVINAIQARTTVLVAGRAFGKGVVHASWLLRNMQRMPGCCIGIVSANIKRALTNTLPSMLVHWEKWGFRRNRHWAVGIRPPKAWHWGEPIFPVQNYENVLSFYNGSIAYIISHDRSGTSNSLSFDALDVDEAKFIDFEQFKDETLPAMRGNRQHFGKKFYHHSMLITSDMPVTKKGSWFLDYDKHCDPELIETIRGTSYEIWKIKQRILELQAKGVQPNEYLRKELRWLSRSLCRMRFSAVDYREVSTLENMQVLGEAFINQLRRDLPPLTFQTSVLCKRIGIARDGFYSKMTERHKYSAPNVAAYDNAQYDFDKLNKKSCIYDSDVDRDMPIYIAFDYNANINWLVAGQPKNKQLRIIKSFFVKYDRKLKELVDDFCDYYEPHRRKQVIFYFDATAKGSNYAVNKEDFRFVIAQRFRQRGWIVTEVYIGRPMRQLEKMLLINRMFAGEARLMPFFNRENNEDLLISIQTAGVYNGGKDKRGEKLPETDSPDGRLEARTDGSDAFDTLAIGCEKFPKTFTGISVTSSF